jgi:hypothetical protein
VLGLKSGLCNSIVDYKIVYVINDLNYNKALKEGDILDGSEIVARRCIDNILISDNREVWYLMPS